MIHLPGDYCTDLCDSNLKMTRRNLLRVGGSTMLGLSLGSLLNLKARAAEAAKGPAGWGRAKSVIMVYLQGGPSHLDLWDPKENVPDKIKSPFKNTSNPNFGRSVKAVSWPVSRDLRMTRSPEM